MDLKEFVAESLKQIIDGIKEAQEYASQNGGVVAPSYNNFTGRQGSEGHKQSVLLDVAVTTQESKGQEGRAGLKIPFLDAGGTLSADQVNSTVSRIKFAVPVEYPVQKD
ncbi:hypothetical protein GM415_08325 [Pseudodesulfovibrio cashew]|uniref:Uncharacterized protein n=1 Tax=Pseudodesulfovibrio cashew TaxID=2678688 RepID=A0A6I6JDC9_9BACT|nr:hypothetical protein [Pseudodesulfovibrio cashew]QGY40131.1 hypothetical protein GM415_08325 [Pseudodesulfovibrio cashew]